MFEAKKRENNFEEQLKNERNERILERNRLEQDKKLAIMEKEFELRHFKDEEIKKITEELNEEKKTNAVLEKENEMLQKITDLNGDIIDIKDLVNKLVEKLPTINLSNLTVNNGDKSK